jgi:pimeloyl-ACP methyl ester carboxylesterase
LAGLILQASPNGGLEETLNYQQLEVALPYLREEVDQNGDGQLSRDELATMPNGPVWYTSLFYIWAPDASPTNPTFQEGLDANGDELIDIDEELLPVMEARLPEIAAAYAAEAPSATVADTIATLEMPILVLHGRQDGWVSFRNAETLAAAAPETVTIIIYPNLGHALSPSRTPATDAFGPIAERPMANVVDWIERSFE